MFSHLCENDICTMQYILHNEYSVLLSRVYDKPPPHCKHISKCSYSQSALQMTHQFFLEKMQKRYLK